MSVLHINYGNDIAVDPFVRSFPRCSQQGRQRALPLIFPPAAIIGSGRCQYRPRPLPTEKAWLFSRSGVAWSPFVAAFFLSSLRLWGNCTKNSRLLFGAYAFFV